MFSEHTVKYSLRYLYRGAVHEYGCEEKSVDTLLQQLNCRKLASAFRQKARRVYAFETLKEGASSPEFRGRDLFDQWAVRIYEDVTPLKNDALPTLSRTWEIWLKEDGNLMTISCIINKDSVETRFREVCGYPFGCDLKLKLENVTAHLRTMYLADQHSILFRTA